MRPFAPSTAWAGVADCIWGDAAAAQEHVVGVMTGGGRGRAGSSAYLGPHHCSQDFLGPQGAQSFRPGGRPGPPSRDRSVLHCWFLHMSCRTRAAHTPHAAAATRPPELSRTLPHAFVVTGRPGPSGPPAGERPVLQTRPAVSERPAAAGPSAEPADEERAATSTTAPSQPSGGIPDEELQVCVCVWLRRVGPHAQQAVHPRLRNLHP